jgi:dihydroorotate dehydrogenase electron transfer subunit
MADFASAPAGITKNNGRITLKIARMEAEGAGAATLYFESGMKVLPGQFLMVTDYEGGEKPISVSEADGSVIAITVKKMGPFSRRLCDKKPGDLISLRGPYGTPFTPVPGVSLLVGGGCGIAPLYLLSRELKAGRNKVIVVNGARVTGDLILGEKFKKLSLDYRETSEDAGEKLTSVQAAGRILEKEHIDCVYAAGPELMMAALKDILKDIPYQFSFERYMKCGVGICGSCACDPMGIRICVEGPVLNRAQVEKLSDFGVYKRDATGARIYFKKAGP